MKWFVAIAIVMVFTVPAAFAHAIRMKVEVNETHVVATVRYDGADEDGGPVTVTLSRREPAAEVAKEILGADGTARFPRPEAGVYRMVAQDEFGHRVQVDFEVPAAGRAAAGSTTPASNWLTLAGVGIVAAVALIGWWLAGRKKSHAP
jgi:hypothetical protein